MPTKKEHSTHLEGNIPPWRETGPSQPSSPSLTQASTSHPQNPPNPSPTLGMTKMSLNDFLIQLITTLLTNQETIIEWLSNVERELTEVKSILHGMRRFKTTTKRSIRIAVEEEEDMPTEEQGEERRQKERT